MIVPFLSALSFLTRLPVPVSVHTDAAALRRAPLWFPAVGLVLGSVYVVTGILFIRLFPPLVTAALLLTADALLTGALHLDGLADTVDGFGGGRNREHILQIMRDHAIGSYGGTAIALLLLLKAGCLSALLPQHTAWITIGTAPSLARWSILLLSRLAPYARATDPNGSGALTNVITARQLTVATFYCAALLLLDPLRIGCAWLCVAAFTLGTAHIAKSKIGGITGDVLGANVVLTEALQLLAALLVPSP